MLFAVFMVTLVLAFAGYTWWLGPAWSNWIIALSLLAGLMVFLLLLWWLARRRSQILGVPPGAWRRDGERVAFVGVLRDTALLPVWSEWQAVAWEASIERKIPRRAHLASFEDLDRFSTERARRRTSPSRILQARGSSPLVVHVEGHGDVRLSGVPDFGLAGRRRLPPEADNLARCALWLLKQGPGAEPSAVTGAGAIWRCTTPRRDARLDAMLATARTQWLREGEDAAIATLSAWMRETDCVLAEHVLAPGQTVGVFGYFRPDRGVVDVTAGRDPWPLLMPGDTKADLAETRRRYVWVLGLLALISLIAHAVLFSIH